MLRHKSCFHYDYTCSGIMTDHLEDLGAFFTEVSCLSLCAETEAKRDILEVQGVCTASAH